MIPRILGFVLRAIIALYRVARTNVTRRNLPVVVAVFVFLWLLITMGQERILKAIGKATGQVFTSFGQAIAYVSSKTWVGIKATGKGGIMVVKETVGAAFIILGIILGIVALSVYHTNFLKAFTLPLLMVCLILYLAVRFWRRGQRRGFWILLVASVLAFLVMSFVFRDTVAWHGIVFAL